MCCNYKGKEFSYKIEITKQPEVLFDEIYNLLHTKFGLLSDKDKIKKRQIFDSINDNKDWNNNWNSIKKKNIKIFQAGNGSYDVRNSCVRRFEDFIYYIVETNRNISKFRHGKPRNRI